MILIYALICRIHWALFNEPTRRTPPRVAFARPWPTTRRGFKLWVLSIIIGLKGVGYARGSVPATTHDALRLFTDTLHIPLEACAWTIIGVCVFAGWCSYCHHGRDKYGYAALTGFCGVWTVGYLSSPIVYGGPGDAIQGALSWFAIGGFLMLCAGDRPGEPLGRGA